MITEQSECIVCGSDDLNLIVCITENEGTMYKSASHGTRFDIWTELRREWSAAKLMREALALWFKTTWTAACARGGWPNPPCDGTPAWVGRASVPYVAAFNKAEPLTLMTADSFFFFLSRMHF